MGKHKSHELFQQFIESIQFGEEYFASDPSDYEENEEEFRV